MSKHDLFFPEDFEEERLKDIETRWAAESEARIDAVDRGELETVEGPLALRYLRSLTKLSVLKSQGPCEYGQAFCVYSLR